MGASASFDGGGAEMASGLWSAVRRSDRVSFASSFRPATHGPGGSTTTTLVGVLSRGLVPCGFGLSSYGGSKAGSRRGVGTHAARLLGLRGVASIYVFHLTTGTSMGMCPKHLGTSLPSFAAYSAGGVAA